MKRKTYRRKTLFQGNKYYSKEEHK